MDSAYPGAGTMQPPPQPQGVYPVTQSQIMQPPGNVPEVQEPPAMDPCAGLQSTTQERKELHISIMCRMGQETVQEIVNKSSELFTILKSLQPPNGAPQSLAAQEERKAKLQEYLKHINICFKKLRRIVEKCNYNTSAMEYTQIEVDSLIPFKDEQDSKPEDKKPSVDVQKLTADNQELIERVMMKNRQLKEIIDKLRTFIWDINTMLAMRKP